MAKKKEEFKGIYDWSEKKLKECKEKKDWKKADDIQKLIHQKHGDISCFNAVRLANFLIKKGHRPIDVYLAFYEFANREYLIGAERCDEWDHDGFPFVTFYPYGLDWHPDYE